MVNKIITLLRESLTAEEGRARLPDLSQDNRLFHKVTKKMKLPLLALTIAGMCCNLIAGESPWSPSSLTVRPLTIEDAVRIALLQTASILQQIQQLTLQGAVLPGPVPAAASGVDVFELLAREEGAQSVSFFFRPNFDC